MFKFGRKKKQHTRELNLGPEVLPEPEPEPLPEQDLDPDQNANEKVSTRAKLGGFL